MNNYLFSNFFLGEDFIVRAFDFPQAERLAWEWFGTGVEFLRTISDIEMESSPLEVFDMWS